MRRKVVSPKSIQSIVVLSPGHGPLTVHKAKKKKKRVQPLKDASLGSVVRTVRGAVKTARVISGIGKVADAVSEGLPRRPRLAAFRR